MEKFDWRQFNADWRHKKEIGVKNSRIGVTKKRTGVRLRTFGAIIVNLAEKRGFGVLPDKICISCPRNAYLAAFHRTPSPRKGKEMYMARPKGENVIRKHFKLTEETAKLLAERSKAEGMNESEYIRYLLLNQSEHPRSRELELEMMRLRNEINKIGLNVNQIVKNNNSHI